MASAVSVPIARLKLDDMLKDASKNRDKIAQFEAALARVHDITRHLDTLIMNDVYMANDERDFLKLLASCLKDHLGGSVLFSSVWKSPLPSVKPYWKSTDALSLLFEASRANAARPVSLNSFTFLGELCDKVLAIKFLRGASHSRGVGAFRYTTYESERTFIEELVFP